MATPTAVFLLLLFIPTAHSCLAIQYSVPPKCICKAQAIGPTNWDRDLPTDNLLYHNLTLYQLDFPIITVDDCSVQISCAGNYNLVVFDNKTSYHFGPFQADGLCDPYQKSWQFFNEDEVIIFQNIYATCIEYSVSICEPLGNKVLNFAVSNDIDKSLVETALAQFRTATGDMNHWSTGLMQFDLQRYGVQPIVLHMWGDWLNHLTNQLPNMQDPSIGRDPSLGSDLFDRIEAYLYNTDILCGGRIIVLMKRYPNERDNTRLIARLRELRVTLLIFGVTGDRNADAASRNMMHRLVTETQGFFAVVDNEADLKTALAQLETINNPYLVYSHTLYEKQGSVEEFLPPLYFPTPNIDVIGMTFISNHGTPGDSKLDHDLYFLGFDGTGAEELVALASLYNDLSKQNWLARRRSWRFKNYIATDKYKFANGWPQNITIRFYSDRPVSKWFRFDN